jgi:hypothetical protein
MDVAARYSERGVVRADELKRLDAYAREHRSA